MTRSRRACAAAGLLAVILCLGCGCTASRWSVSTGRHFDFSRDTFSFRNEISSEYRTNAATGQRESVPVIPKPEYTQHCFVVALSACQFFENARFDASQPKADESTYANLIRRVVHRSLRRPLTEHEKILIPGYADLRSFSAEHEELLKRECGGAWQSYFQRGHWRMIFPFTRNHQKKMAAQLFDDVMSGHPPVVHLVTFPRLSINHAVVVIGAERDAQQIRFSVYDPNNSAESRPLTFDESTRTFSYPANRYYKGGSLNVYEVYRGVFY